MPVEPATLLPHRLAVVSSHLRGQQLAAPRAPFRTRLPGVAPGVLASPDGAPGLRQGSDAHPIII